MAVYNTNPKMKEAYEKLSLQIFHLKTSAKNISVFLRKSKLIGDQGKGIKKITLQGGLKSIG